MSSPGKFTLLEIAQEIASAMDSEELNSLNDTQESQQIALLLKGVYYDCITDTNFPELNVLFQLNASGDESKPVLMTVPEDITLVKNIRYNIKEDGEVHANWKELEPVPFVDFLGYQNSLRDMDNSGSMELEIDGESFEIMYRTNQHPKYYTSVQNKYIIFDAYDNSIDAALQKAKTLCEGVRFPEFVMDDNFIPPFDPTQFRYFIQKAKTRAFIELKQTQNPEAAGEARRQKIIIQKRKRRVPEIAEISKIKSRYGRK
jgi:hypothetical protein